MALPKLFPAAEQVPVQDTAFTTDAMGRFICSTWGEATANGGAPFSAVIIGAGAYGAYCAARLYRNRPNKRVLLLDAGSLLVTEHVQNLGRVGLDVPAPITPASDPHVPRALVWGLPWRGNVDFPGLAYCAGGKSIYWGGWSPRLTSQDLLQWPSSAAAYLNANYSDVESETGGHAWHLQYRNGDRQQRCRGCAARRPGQPSRVGTLQLRQVQQPATAHRCRPRGRHELWTE